jgi:acetyl esterase/lipase
VYRPATATGPLPGLAFIHGGGMVVGDLDAEHATAVMLCEHLDAVIVSLDYRKAPEHPFPAGLDDCYAGVQWLLTHRDEFDVSGPVGVYGGSAGGYLAIATTLLARDRGVRMPAFVMAPYPMLDDRNETASSREITDIGVWDRATAVEAWAWYLEGQTPDAYAAPARAADLTGLPPTFIDVGELDVMRDEDTTFALRLTQAGVPTEFHLYPGAFHGSEIIAPEAALSRRIIATRLAALHRWLRT